MHGDHNEAPELFVPERTHTATDAHRLFQLGDVERRVVKVFPGKRNPRIYPGQMEV